ncbi:MAG TPA: DUF4932 domain-containing protein [Puia sp.]|nr:DUF4932 domain-containing protein [Puia sp.]
MKKIGLPVLFCFLIISALSQPTTPAAGISGPAVDERVEIMSIAARLAGYEEYNMDFNKVYVAAIHHYFDAFKDHPLIRYLQSVRESNSIGYDAVMGMAVHLSPPPAFQPLVTFTVTVPDKRWGADSAIKLAGLLRRFYTDTDFGSWFRRNATLYQQATDEFGKVFGQLDVQWYYRYYGIVPKGEFRVVLGLANGGGNYGPKVVWPDGRETFYAIMGAWSFDSTGKPVFDVKGYLPTLIHEFNHSFVNYLTEKNKTSFGAAGDTIYSVVGAKMRRLAYGDWPVMFSEALVRASVIRYLMGHNSDSAAKKELSDQMSIGFIWMDQLVDLLGLYESDRKKYPTLESFMPRIVDFYQTTAANIHALAAAYAKLQPHVSSIEQFRNGDSGVDPGLTTIKIHFDKPLAGKGISINYGKGGKDHWPAPKSLGYADDNSSIVLQVALKPDTEYQFILTGRRFQTPDGYPLDDYEVHFKTGK